VANAVEVVTTLSRGGDRARQLLEERVRLLPAPEVGLTRPRRDVKAGRPPPGQGRGFPRSMQHAMRKKTKIDHQQINIEVREHPSSTPTRPYWNAAVTTARGLCYFVT
jgi:hypothetical protein